MLTPTGMNGAEPESDFGERQGIYISLSFFFLLAICHELFRSQNYNSKCKGVDANRNYPWHFDELGVSKDPCS